MIEVITMDEQPVKIKRANGKDTAHAILITAKDLFLNSGFSAVSISDIAKKAGVTRSLIFHHFKTKIELWQNVESYLTAELEHFYGDLLRQTSLGRTQLLDMVFHQCFSYYDEKPEYIKLLFWQLLDNDKQLQAVSRNMLIKSLKRVIKILQRDKRLRNDLDPEVIEMVLLNGVFGPLMLKKARALTRKQKQQYIEFTMENLNKALAFRKEVKKTTFK